MTTKDIVEAIEQAIPFRGRFSYSRAELIADGVVHAIGIVIALAAGAAMLVFAFVRTGPGEYFAAIFYLMSLLTVLVVSCLYNLWPISPTKWILRRFDHAGIYMLIAGTYTPFIAQLDDRAVAGWTLALVWSAALAGMALKLFMPGRFDRLSIGFYLALGWSGLLVAGDVREALSGTTLMLIAAGGIVYSLGVIFFVWHRLRFQSAVWHGFVVTGAALHLLAVADSLVLARL